MEEETKFEIRDKRPRFSDDTDQSVAEDTAASMPVTFSSFILSLATSALMHLGQEGPPQVGAGSVHLPLARQVIDLISLLEEKTKGNRTSEEEEILSQTLFTLRIKFVEIEKKLRST